MNVIIIRTYFCRALICQIKFTASQALVIFIAATLGGIIATTLGLIKNIKLSSELRKTKKENESMKKKLQIAEEKAKEINKTEK